MEQIPHFITVPTTISFSLSCTSDGYLFTSLPGAFTHIETKEHGATFDRAPTIAHGIYLIRKKGFLLVYP